MIKKLSACIAALAVILSAASVYADIIGEPLDGGFYSSHREECEFIGYRTFVVTNSCGLSENPDSDRLITSYSAGEYIQVSRLYTDSGGNVWGCSGFTDGGGNYTDGWVSLENIVRVYDRFDFDRDCHEKFVGYSGALDGAELNENIVLWDYPLSGNSSLPMEYELRRALSGSRDSLLESAYKTGREYTDANGDVWVNLFNNPRFGWIYAKDPFSADISGTAPQTVTALPDRPDFLIPVLSAAASAAISAALLICIRARHSK